MLFTDEHDLLRKSLKTFIAREIEPHVEEWEEARIFPAHDLFKKMGNEGFLGLTKPTEYGGSGLDYSYAVVMAEELGHIQAGGVSLAEVVQVPRGPAPAVPGCPSCPRALMTSWPPRPLLSTPTCSP